MSKSIGTFLSVACLSAVSLFTGSAWAQITHHNQSYALASAVNTKSDSSTVHATQPVNPATHAPAENDGSVVIELVAPKDIAPSSAAKTIPPTLTVTTAALLELHAMRQNAVDLCLQLPSKYRTRLPQCAKIFEHEIRLKQLAKERQAASESSVPHTN